MEQRGAASQRVVWKAVAFVSGLAAAAGVRRAATLVWRTSKHEDPPVHPGSRRVRLRDALTWAVSVAVGAAVARVVAERAAAAAWNAATGEPPPELTD
jgi:Protein of unknown function (DUF4235)